MDDYNLDIVTGSFGYIGKYLTRQLLALGKNVKTITTHPNKPNPFGSQVEAFPYDFDKPDRLTANLQGVENLYNTYWIRFPHGELRYEQALANTWTLFNCAREAGVHRIIQISVTHASSSSELPYYQGKGLQEEMLAELEIPHVIIRPTLVFGKEDILVNNIAWLIRKFPVFPVFGNGKYKVQPVCVDDLARIAITNANSPSGTILDAIGPETFSFKEFLQLIVDTLERPTQLIHLPPSMGIALGKMMGLFVRDQVLTRNELRGLMNEYLLSAQSPNADTLFSDWLKANKKSIGLNYSSELDRHFRWEQKRELDY